jgi:hypothetical protein
VHQPRTWPKHTINRGIGNHVGKSRPRVCLHHNALAGVANKVPTYDVRVGHSVDRPVKRLLINRVQVGKGNLNFTGAFGYIVYVLLGGCGNAHEACNNRWRSVRCDNRHHPDVTSHPN